MPTVYTDPGGHDFCFIICINFDPGAWLGGLGNLIGGGLGALGGALTSAIPGLGPVMASFHALQPALHAFSQLDWHAIVQVAVIGVIGLGVGLLAAPLIGWALDAARIGGAAAIILGGILVGAISGVAGQAYSNAINGRPLTDGLGKQRSLARFLVERWGSCRPGSAVPSMRLARAGQDSAVGWVLKRVPE